MIIFAPNNTRKMADNKPLPPNSPRHKYRAVLCLRAPEDEKETRLAIPAPSAEKAQERAIRAWKRLGNRDGSHDYVFVWYNKAEYPDCDWFFISYTTLTASADGTARSRPRKPVKPPKVVKKSGGKRLGAGRKASVPADQKKVNITLSVTPQEKAQCELMRQKGINLSEEFSKVVKRLAKILC